MIFKCFRNNEQMPSSVERACYTGEGGLAEWKRRLGADREGVPCTYSAVLYHSMIAKVVFVTTHLAYCTIVASVR